MDALDAHRCAETAARAYLEISNTVIFLEQELKSAEDSYRRKFLSIEDIDAIKEEIKRQKMARDATHEEYKVWAKLQHMSAKRQQQPESGIRYGKAEQNNNGG